MALSLWLQRLGLLGVRNAADEWYLELQGRNGSGPGMHDFARQGTLAGEASLPSDVDTPHSRNGSTPSSIGRLQRIGAAQLWQVCQHVALRVGSPQALLMLETGILAPCGTSSRLHRRPGRLL